jgi:hypothetical protein
MSKGSSVMIDFFIGFNGMSQGIHTGWRGQGVPPSQDVAVALVHS